MTNKDKMVEAGACVPMQPKTSKDLFGPVNFSVFFKNYIKIKFKDLIWTSKFKFSFRGLVCWMFLVDTAAPNNILYGVMSGNLKIIHL
jgi:hypothetical protein